MSSISKGDIPAGNRSIGACIHLVAAYTVELLVGEIDIGYVGFVQGPAMAAIRIGLSPAGLLDLADGIVAILKIADLPEASVIGIGYLEPCGVAHIYGPVRQRLIRAAILLVA